PAVKVSHPHPNPQRLVAHLVHEPPIPGSVPGRTRCVDELGGERLHPPIHRHVINLDTSLGQQLLHVAVGQPLAQIPPHPPPRSPPAGSDNRPEQTSPDLELITRSGSSPEGRPSERNRPAVGVWR